MDAEWDDRHERRLQRLLKAALSLPGRHQGGRLLAAKCGSGKSFLASALGHQACLRGFRVGYHACSRLFGQLRLAKADGTYVRGLEKISKQALIIIDLSRPCDYPDGVRGVDGPVESWLPRRSG